MSWLMEKQLNILLVEDNAAHCALIKHYLSQCRTPPVITTVASLAEAREAIADGQPDLALVDLKLPDGLGTELLDDGIFPRSFPIVIMTSQGDETAAVEAIKRGAIDYAVKSETTFAEIVPLAERVLREWDNLSARKLAEDNLRRSEDRYRRLSQEFQLLLDGITDAIALIGPDMRMVWANNLALAAAASGRWQRGVHCFNFWHDRTEICTSCPVQTAFATGEQAEVISSLPGGRIWGTRAFPLKGPDGEVANVILVATDITEKTLLRAESMRSGQLVALGELAAGVAHEINNPINGIINYAQLLLDRQLAGAGEELVHNIIEEGERVARIVSNLLMFARKPQTDYQPFSLSSALQGVLSLTGSNFRHESTRLEVDIEENLPPILGHYAQIQQVFINILSNACYALNQKFPDDPEQKKIRIEVRRLTQPGEDWLRTTVTDNGVGIAPLVLERICTPFFTTKPQGDGTGLGMSISHGIVTDHRGRLLVSSEVGAWTRIVVDLPVVKEGGTT